MVYLFPYIEQGALYQQWNFKASYDAALPVNTGGSGITNTALLPNVWISGYFCPSSPLPKTCAAPVGTAVNVQAASYVGIAGTASTGTVAGTTVNTQLISNAANILYTETRNKGGAGGVIGGSGVIFPNSKISIQEITDGSSNVALVSEQNDWMQVVPTSGTGGLAKCAFHASEPSGLHIGCLQKPMEPDPNRVSAGLRTQGWTEYDQPAFNLATIGYSINMKKGPAGTGWPRASLFAGNWDPTTSPVVQATAVGNGSATDYPNPNIPLNSAHPGGVNVLLGDGSVRFTSDSTSMLILAEISTRDDGQPVVF